MFDNKSMHHDCFKEAVCINSKRVYDACRDRDCLEDLRVYFCDKDQEIIKHALSVKLKSAEVIHVYIDTEPVPFNRGYYCVDLTIYFAMAVDAALSPIGNPTQLYGISVCHKKAILYGSEGSVKTFCSEYVLDGPDVSLQPSNNLPIVTVQVADPVPLGSKLVRVDSCPNLGTLPTGICQRFPGDFSAPISDKIVEASIGMFMLIELEREVQMLIPVYDFCMPEKICIEESVMI